MAIKCPSRLTSSSCAPFPLLRVDRQIKVYFTHASRSVKPETTAVTTHGAPFAARSARPRVRVQFHPESLATSAGAS